MTSIYSSCIIYDENSCGIGKNGEKDVIFIKHLNRDITKHYKSIKINTSGLPLIYLSEKSLVENRIFKKLDDENKICPRHRDNMGIYWRPSTKCAANQTPNKCKSKPRALPLHLLLIHNKSNQPIAIGSQVCEMHYKKLSVIYKSTQTTDRFEATENEDDLENDDNDYTPDVVLNDIDNETPETSFELSPFKFQVTKSKIEHLAPSSLAKVRQKYEREKKRLKLSISERFAPGQGEILAERLSSSDSDREDDGLEETVELYRASDSISRRVILSLQNHKKFTRGYLIDRFGCSYYDITEARKMRKQSDSLILPTIEKKIRHKLDMVKVEHFLEFIFNSGLMQDVAYGTHNIKFDSGLKIKVANSVLTTRYSHAITLYLKSCDNFDPLSSSTLFRIMKALKPSQRKSLAGLDDTTAAGLNAFTLLQNFASQFGEKKLSQNLEKAMRYVKTTLQTNLNTQSTVATHSTAKALSDIKNQLLCQEHLSNDEICNDCVHLFSSIDNVRHIAEQKSTNEDELYDINIAITSVKEYIQHQVRDAQQRKAKEYCFSMLSESCAFWLKDFAQKILPMQYRESQRDYFGKKGMTLHVDVFFYKNQKQEIIKITYFTAITRCEQGLTDVLSICDEVLNKFKKDHPSIDEMFIKSDNAGCYHSNYSAEGMYHICKQHNITLLRYDFNEPSKGKDQCDRDSASAKTVLRSFVNAGNQIMNADDIYEGLHYGSGVSNAYVAVMEIDNSKAYIKAQEIPLISQLHSFAFKKDYMLVWRYFNIGEGIKVEYSPGIKFQSGATLKKPFHATSERRDPMKTSKTRQDRELSNVIFCNESSNCIASFSSIDKYNIHLAEGCQILNSNKVTSMDVVRQNYIKHMKQSSMVHIDDLGGENYQLSNLNLKTVCQKSPSFSEFAKTGSCLPVRKTFRFNTEQKQILLKLFLDGETTKKKITPEEAAKEIRAKLTPDMYVSTQQIKSLFSRLAKKARTGGIEEFAQIEPSDINRNDCVFETNQTVQEIATDMVSDMEELMCNDWVAVRYGDDWFPGSILQISDQELSIHCMKYVSGKDKNVFVPTENDKFVYTHDDILCKLSPPYPINQRHFKFPDEDFEKANEQL